MKISVIGDIINDSLNEKELEIMRHFSRTELKAAINMLKEFTAKGNFAVLMYMGDTDKLERKPPFVRFAIYELLFIIWKHPATRIFLCRKYSYDCG